MSVGFAAQWPLVVACIVLSLVVVNSFEHRIHSDGDDVATAATIDLHGNVISVGRFGGNSVCGEANSGMDDVFIVKYNLTGQLLWLKTLGTSSAESISAVEVDSMGRRGSFQNLLMLLIDYT